MLPNKLQLILLILNLFWLPVSTSYNEGTPVCGNTQIQCYDTSFYGFVCDITGLNTELIQQTLYDCALNIGTGTVYIDIETGGVGVTLNLTFPDNVGGVYIENRFRELITVETSVVNTQVESMEFYGFEVYINHNDFFSYFPSLEYFYADIIGSERMPIFSQNLNLTEIDVYASIIRNESSNVITREMIGDLPSLEYFYWINGGVTGITSDAFTD